MALIFPFFVAILAFFTITEQSSKSLKDLEQILKNLAVQTAPKARAKTYENLPKYLKPELQQDGRVKFKNIPKELQYSDNFYQPKNKRIPEQLEDELQQALRYESDRICKSTGRCGCFGERCGRPQGYKTVDDMEQLLQEINNDLNEKQYQNFRSDEDRQQRYEQRREKYDDSRQEQDDRRQKNNNQQYRGKQLYKQLVHGYKGHDYDYRNLEQNDREQKQDQRKQRQYNRRQPQDDRSLEYDDRRQRQRDRIQRQDDRKQRQDERSQEYDDRRQRQDERSQEYDDRRQRQHDRRQRQDDRSLEYNDRTQRQDDRRQKQDDGSLEYYERRQRQDDRRQRQRDRRQRQGDRSQEYDDRKQRQDDRRQEYDDVNDVDQNLKIRTKNYKNADFDIVILEAPEANELHNRANNVKVIDISERGIRDLLQQQQTSYDKNEKKEQLFDSLSLEDFVEYYERMKKELTNALLRYVKGERDGSHLSLLLPYQRKQIEYLKKVQSKKALSDDDLKANIVQLLFGSLSNIKLLPHSKDGQTIYIPERMHNAIPVYNRSNTVRTNKRLFPLTFYQKQRQRNLFPRNIILKHSWRRNNQQVPNYGVPFDLQVQGLGQVN